MLKKSNQELAYDIENRLLKVEDKTQEGPGGKSISFSLYLAPGWNNFSLPIILSDTKVSSSLASISGKFDQISRYNPSTKAFEHYVANPKYDQFSELEYGRGYQIYVTSPQGCLLSLSGILPKTSSVSLKAGANLIFSPFTQETPVEEALSPLKLGLDYSKLIHYNKEKSLFEKYDSSSKEFLTLKPGESYYLYCLRDTSWSITNTQSPATTFIYDGDGGRVKKNSTNPITQQTQETLYIGSLFEIQSSADGRQSIVKHIFAGANRVATVSSQGATTSSVSLRGASTFASLSVNSASDEAISYYH